MSPTRFAPPPIILFRRLLPEHTYGHFVIYLFVYRVRYLLMLLF